MESVWGVIVKKFNSNKKIIIGLIVAILIIFSVTYTATKRNEGNKNSFPFSVLNDFVGLVDKGISIPINFVESGVSSVNKLFNTYEENEKLKAKLDSYDALVSENQEYKSENEKLKQQLDLNATLSSYSTVTANVISRSPDTWQDVLVIDQGSKNGIKVNMPVMGSKGLIGRVVEVDSLSSKVELLTSSNQSSNHFPVKIQSSGEAVYGLLEDYDEKTNSFIVSQLSADTELKEGDLVSTSGLGGNSPANLYVGTVLSVKSDSYGLDKEIYVTPAASLYDMSVVTVIQRSAESGE